MPAPVASTPVPPPAAPPAQAPAPTSAPAPTAPTSAPAPTPQPQLSGVVQLMLEKNSHLKPTQINDVLRDSLVTGEGGQPVLDVARAVALTPKPTFGQRLSDLLGMDKPRELFARSLSQPEAAVPSVGQVLQAAKGLLDAPR